jgi:phage terminase large subunit GpA-like protein
VAFLEVLHKVANASARIATPPPLLTVADWADEYLFLSPEDSAEAGKYRTDRAPYQREMLEVVSDPNIKEVVYCTSSQIGKTLLSKCIIGYHIHQDPGPIIVMQPTVKIAETFSKDRLSPMVRDTPVLKRLIADPKSRSSGNTIDHKTFPGGHITMIGANAPSDLASRPIRIVFADEVDRYPVSAGSEGDPLFLARQRSVTFWNRKFVMASTPTMEGASRIWREFERSDMRYFYLPCPHCGVFHTLKWPQIVWDEGDASSARAVCPECGSIYENADKLKMLAAGEWRAHNQNPRVAGFHISALYSPWQTFADVVQEFLDKKDHPETLKTFINLQLGECFEDRTGEKIDQSGLMARREQWDHVPEDVVLITAGVDVQGDRLEVSIIGYTAKDQSRVLHHLRLYGNPGEPKIWQTLDDLLLQPLMTETGALMSIRAACIDSGGHHTQEVYKFCGERAGRRVMAIKGRAGALPIWPTKLSRKKLKHGASLHIIGVDTAKDVIHSSLSVIDPDLPKYVAFSAGLPEDYFGQLVAERRVPKVNKSGFTTRTWVKKSGDRNEALDCFVYALAALKMLESMKPNLLRFARPQYSAPKPKATPDAETAPPRPPATRRTSSAIL